MNRTAQLRTDHDEAGLVAATLQPDNTPEVETRVDGGAVVTRIDRDKTDGLAQTVDDYAVNLPACGAGSRAREDERQRERERRHD